MMAINIRPRQRRIKGSGSLRSRAEGTYEIRYVANGKPRYESIHGSLEDAEAVLHERCKQLYSRTRTIEEVKNSPPKGIERLRWAYNPHLVDSSTANKGVIKPRNKPNRIPIRPKLRFKILERDKFKCTYCGVSRDSAVLHVDHVLPVSKGGTDDEANLRTACQLCNIGKGISLLKENFLV
tara:strand:+ start:559 stop:1101 length:543 start_codon:yes stop_codon:yes gene_type:complete